MILAASLYQHSNRILEESYFDGESPTGSILSLSTRIRSNRIGNPRKLAKPSREQLIWWEEHLGAKIESKEIGKLGKTRSILLWVAGFMGETPSVENRVETKRKNSVKLGKPLFLITHENSVLCIDRFFWCRCCFPLAGEPGGRVRHFANGGRGLVRQSVADRTPAHPRRGRPQSRQQRRHLASRILSRIPLQLLPSVPFFLLSLLSTPKRKKRKKNRFSKSSFRVRSPSPESSTGKKKQ